MKTKILGYSAIVAAACVGGATPAFADPLTATGHVAVSATLTAACYIGDGTLSFGSFASLNQGTTAATPAVSSGASADTGAIDYVCSNGATAALSLQGAHDDGSQLNMSNGTALLPYSVAFSNGGASIDPVENELALDADGTTKSVTLYGSIPASAADLPIGEYDDTLTLTVAY